MKLSIIIVNYNSWDLLYQCLATIPSALDGCSAEVFVVDNHSRDDQSKKLMQAYPWIRIIRNEQNIGFAAANNVGIMKSSGEYIMLLNPDTEAEPGAFKELVTFLDQMPDAGIVGPKLYYPDGELQYSCGRFPTLISEIVENFSVQKLFPRHTSPGFYLYRQWDHATTRRVDWVTGACFVIRRKIIEQIGLLDESYFMYSEELDWCYRARERGWNTYYHPTAVLLHHEGGSSRNLSGIDRFQNLVYHHYIRSSRLFFRKFYGNFMEFLLRLVLYCSHYFRLLKAQRRFVKDGHSQDVQTRLVVFRNILQDLAAPVSTAPSQSKCKSQKGVPSNHEDSLSHS